MIGSAYWIAAVRARETTRSDRLFEDPYAAALAGDRGVATMAASERAAGGENKFLPVRTRWFDDVIGAAVAGGGVDQIVLLGAGLDTRPYRLQLAGDVTWFEADDRALLAEKNSILPEHGARVCVPTDLGVDGLTPLLIAGLDPARPIMWVAELAGSGWEPAVLTWAGNTDANFGRLRDTSRMPPEMPRSHLVVARRA
jgi:methyltransferase (TIGR00027 family)